MTQLYEQQVQAVDGETIGITIPGMYVTHNLTGTLFECFVRREGHNDCFLEMDIVGFEIKGI